MAATAGNPADDVITLKISGTGLQNFIVTYASQSSAGQTQTWAYSVNGTTFTTLTTLSASTTFAATGVLTADFSGSTANSVLANAATVFLRDTITAGNGSDIAFDNFAITAVPEPINYAMAGFGLIFVGGNAGRFYLRRKNISSAA